MAKLDKSHPARMTGTVVSSRRKKWVSRLLRKGMFTASLLGALLGTGCSLQEWVHNGFKVGPNYSRPPAPVAEAWIDYQDPRIKSEEADLSHWWHRFKDPFLNSLIDTAYQQNLSLRVAGARILEARAQRGFAAGNLFPQLQQAFGDASRVKLSQKRANPFPAAWFPDWDAGVTTSWELDFWGRFRRAIEAADADLDASIENYDDVLVILLSDIATNYTQLRTFQERLRLAWNNVVSQYNSYHVTAHRFILGASTERDVQQARQVLEQTRALLPQFEAGIRLANNQLCILLGIPPHELGQLEVGTYERALQPLAELTAARIEKVDTFVTEFRKERKRPAEAMPGLLQRKNPKDAELLATLGTLAEARFGTIIRIPREACVGIPADLLRRRPDVRRAERQVAAQSARIGIAKADFYPRFSLLGELGVAAEQFGDLFDTPRSMFGSITPSFRWDILNYGRILNNVRVQDARFQGLAFTYQNTVLSAGREAEDAIVTFLKAQEQTDRLAASVDAAQRAVDITFDQYRQGAVDFTAVFLFEGTLADQQDQLTVARSNIALNLIRLYRSLGGGWEMRLKRDGLADHGHPHHAQDNQQGGQPAAVHVSPAPQQEAIVSIRLRPMTPKSTRQVKEIAPVENLPPVERPTARITEGR